MLSNHGFDLWADGYDQSVGLSDEENTYPFAGYKAILGEVYDRALSHPGRTVLDIGFGTGTLTAKLYEHGCSIFGQDFSSRMIELAQEKMPGAKLFQGDFSEGLVPELTGRSYDTIIATYSLHPLTDVQKILLIRSLLSSLNRGGRLLIGDVAFENRCTLEQCKAQCADEWGEDEIYFVYDEMKPHFPSMTFTPFSACAGVLEIAL